MATVKPVEYTHDSSTVGFAVEGDKKQITQSSANTIQKDVDQGFVKPLDNAQDHQLGKFVDSDTIDYTDEEMKNVGKQQIDTKGTDGSNALTDTASLVGAGGAVAGAALGKGALASTVSSSSTSFSVGASNGSISATTTTSQTTLGSTSSSSTTTTLNPDGTVTQTQSAEKTSKIPFAALIAGAIELAVGIASLVCVNAFDSEFKNRKEQRDSAGDTNAIMQSYTDEIIGNMDSMTADSEMYNELCAEKMENDIDKISEIGALRAQMGVYAAQGNSSKVGEIQGQITKIEGEADGGDTTVEEMNGIKANLESYSAKNAEAEGVAESGTLVSDFLKGGKVMGALAIAGSAAFLVAGALMAKSTINAIKAAAQVPTLAGGFIAKAIAIAAVAMMTAGNLMILGAAVKMAIKAADEFKCGSAGDDMGEVVGTLDETVTAGDEYLGSTEAGLLESDSVASEATGAAQDGVDESIQKQQDGFVNAGSGTTGDTTGGTTGAGEGSGAA